MTKGRKKSPNSEARIAEELGISQLTLTRILCYDIWPKKMPDGKRYAITRALEERGKVIGRLLDKPNACAYTMAEVVRRTKKAAPKLTDEFLLHKEKQMMLCKQRLTEASKKQWKLFRDPFMPEISDRADVYLSPDIRYVREAIMATAKHGGILAVIGESGAGKTVIKKDFIERLETDHAQVVVIEPYVLAMEENDIKGKSLKSTAIAESIIRAVNPAVHIRRSAESRFNQLHQILKDSKKSGNKHVLIIEEAHGLPTSTLKHLKRFYEIEDGFKKLLSIILIGQPELRMKLSEKNLEVREVVQRCEIVELPPLGNYLGEYINFKFERIGGKADSIIADDAIEALREKLTFTRKMRSGREISTEIDTLLYPLAVGNLLTAAMNTTAQIGAEKVTAEIINSL